MPTLAVQATVKLIDKSFINDECTKMNCLTEFVGASEAFDLATNSSVDLEHRRIEISYHCFHTRCQANLPNGAE